MLTLEEEAEVKLVEKFKKEIAVGSVPVSNLLNSLLAEIYWQYYQDNSWKIRRRTPVAKGDDNHNLLTWDNATFQKEIHFHYQQSLKNKSRLQATSIEAFSHLMIEGDAPLKARPTLFDFVAHRALDYYQSKYANFPEPTYPFKLDEAHYFTLFYHEAVEERDSLSLPYNVLKTYNELVAFHLNDPDPTARVYLELARLDYLKENASIDNPEMHYSASLVDLLELVKEHEISALIAFDIASHDHIASSNYENDKDVRFKHKRREAVARCKEAVSQFPDSFGGRKCQALLNSILKEEMAIKTEGHVSVGLPSRVLLEYRNIDHLYFHLFEANYQKRTLLKALQDDSSKIATIKSLPIVQSWSVSPIDDEDFHKHSTEIVIPKLEAGPYYLVASRDSIFNHDEGVYSYVDFQVTDLALIKNSIEQQGQLFHVLNRSTGNPKVGATINLTNRNGYGKRRINKTIKSDDDGMAFVNVSDYYYNVEARVSLEGDTAVFENFYLSKRNGDRKREKEEINAKAFLFTDRSIYRPGQKIYFKGILVQRAGDESEVVPNEYVEIYLDDVNGEEVGFQRLKTNKYGSFSGEFIIPVSGITGEYDLYAEEDYEEDSKFYDEVMDDFEYSHVYISVEEYKRPTFEVNFEPVTASYRVHDTVTVRGHAKSFSGADLLNANVSFKVQRTTSLPNWYSGGYRPIYSSGTQEIAFGEMTTKENGAFEIKFCALPDTKRPKEQMPVFHYKIEADVTDVNGETRSTSRTVKVGYVSLAIHLSNESQYDLNEKQITIPVSVKNFNDQDIATNGTFDVYLLSAPDKVKRIRPWDAPDRQLINKEEFGTLFPHDYYLQSGDLEEKELVGTYTFDTSLSKEVTIEKIRNWLPGKYLIEATCRDEYGDEVVAKSMFDLVDFKQPGKDRLFFIKKNKGLYNVGEDVEITYGSASKDLTVVIEVEKNGRVINRYFEHLNNQTKKLKIPVTTKDKHGFAVHYFTVNHNSFVNGVLNIAVSKSIPRLSIETSSFRDKILPGSEETWRFTITGENKEQVEAELLATMYDASLDQFKPHSFSFNPYNQKPGYHTYARTEAGSGFGNTISQNRNLYYNYQPVPTQRFNKLDWFGFSLNSNSWVIRKYKERIAYALYQENVNRNSSTNERNQSGLKKGMIQGIVVDELGEPLPAVTILVKGTTRGTVSDSDGNYALLAKTGETLAFSFIGYKGLEMAVGRSNTIDVTLIPDIGSLNEVVVTAYGLERKTSALGFAVEVDEEVIVEEILFAEAPGEAFAGGALASKMAGVHIADNQGGTIQLRGYTSLNGSNTPLYVIDGKLVESLDVMQSEIQSINVLKGAAATAIYGNKGANGVVIITTKSGQEEIARQLAQVQARKNFNETAFFYPHLQTDDKGNVSFSFTTPESLTRWKLNLLTHTPHLQYGNQALESVSQKDLMVVPNPPRFLREGDEIVFSAKITNLSADSLSGFVALQLTDALTGKPIDAELQNQQSQQNFYVAGKKTTATSWSLYIPENIQAVQYRIVAKSGDYSDGEQNILPVLSNRLLVTETLPMNVKSKEVKAYQLTRLKQNASSTLSHHKLTLEVTSNPAWYAIKSLPYLMEYPYECAEQTFSRYYSNAIASHILHSSPRIKEVFDEWAAYETASTLEKNADLKSIIINETPWLRDAQSEAEQQKRLAELFDLEKLASQQGLIMDKLSNMQFGNGGLPWFSGSRYANRYISQHVAAGFAHLSALGMEDPASEGLVNRLLAYLDKELINDYGRILERADNSEVGRKEYLKQNHLTSIQVQYLYIRSYYRLKNPSNKLKEAVAFFKRQSSENWTDYNLSNRGMIALIHYRDENFKLAEGILSSLEENSIVSDELGRYWKANTSGWRWDEAPIETQALLIEVFSQINVPNRSEEAQQKIVDELKLWLLKQKQTNHWPSTKSTTEAIYALLLTGSDWLSIEDQVTVHVGGDEIATKDFEDGRLEAGTGYFNTSWKSEEIVPEMADVQLRKRGEGVAWGAMYWQYFEDLDNITAATTPLKLKKQLYLKRNTPEGKKLVAIDEDEAIGLGDVVTVRIELTTDRTMNFVHMKDMRASGFEPVNVLSEYKWQDGLGYYESTRDASTNFFFEELRKGTYVFEYDLRANNKGIFSNGIATIQSMYAPEFSSHSEGQIIKISE